MERCTPRRRGLGIGYPDQLRIKKLAHNAHRFSRKIPDNNGMISLYLHCVCIDVLPYTPIRNFRGATSPRPILSKSGTTGHRSNTAVNYSIDRYRPQLHPNVVPGIRQIDGSSLTSAITSLVLYCCAGPAIDDIYVTIVRSYMVVRVQYLYLSGFMSHHQKRAANDRSTQKNSETSRTCSLTFSCPRPKPPREACPTLRSSEMTSRTPVVPNQLAVKILLLPYCCMIPGATALLRTKKKMYFDLLGPSENAFEHSLCTTASHPQGIWNTAVHLRAQNTQMPLRLVRTDPPVC